MAQVSQQVTMSDVARRAGVTRATVSFVINQRAKDLRISPKTQARVLKAIEALNYRVNSAAQSTSRGRTYGIGILAPGGTQLNAAWSEQVEGIHRAADERGYHVVFVGANEVDLSKPDYAPKMIQQNLVDGVIFLISVASVGSIDRVIQRYHIPTVWIQRRRAHDAIWLDEAAFAEESVAHLAAQGHRRICLLDSEGEAETLWSRERRAGFQRAIKKSKTTGRIVELRGADVPGHLAELLSETRRPTGFVVGAPVFANYLLTLAHLRGLRVPQDVALVSIASAREAVGTLPKLTHWNNELEKLGYQAGKMLIDGIEQHTQQPALMLRGRLCPAGTTVIAGENHV